jgi:thiol-disulfide isomerase/thioredoxin
MIASWVLAAVAVTVPGDVTSEFVAEGVTARVGGYRPIRAEMKDSIEGVKVAPEGLSAPKYGKIELGDKSWLFILDEPEGKPAKLYIDTNGDGDLTNDPAAPWAANPQGGLTMHRGSGKVDLGNGQVGSLGLYRFDPKDPRRAALANVVLFYTDFGYQIGFELDGKPFETFFSGAPVEGMSLWVDRDKNGIRSSKREMVAIGRPFNFTGTTYVLTVADGKVGISESTEEIPMSPLPPNLAVGQKAIPFAMKSLSGEEIDFPGAYEGKVVMLDFWATWCGPCIAEIPNVKAAYDKWHGEGFEVIGISFDREGMADKVKDFITTREMPWPQLYEGKYWSTSLGENYDVSSIPFVLLVDGTTGEILATREKLRGPGLSDFIGEVLANRKDK